MDKTSLMALFKENDIHSVKPRTQLSSYTTATYANMTAAQVNNRSSATWKTAQFIIVDDCQPEDRDTLLTKWRELTGSYTGQYLFAFNAATQRYDIYDCQGLFLFDDSSISRLVTSGNGTVNYAPGEGINKIFYGVPGCGKSYHIQHNILDKENYAPENVIRTTFYQDYSNTDFVGQILPKIVKGENGADDTVEYIFNPGPFTLALIQAIKNPTENVALVVEEINRGNAPAIFGDIFQLLDRKNGISEYGVKNVQVMDYLNNYDFGENGEEKRYHFEEIKIPGNLYIYATMNTSDQNVYTLDTAFTRRWNKEKISNNFINDKDKDYFKKRFVPGTDVLWKDFANAINEYISSKLDDLQVNEDKLIGAYFVKDNSLSVETESGRTTGDKLILNFAYKVLEYLWSDVSKLDHNIIFKSVSKDNKKINTLDALVGEFKKNGLSIFQDSIIKNMYKKEPMIEDNNNPGIIDESADVNE